MKCVLEDVKKGLLTRHGLRCYESGRVSDHVAHRLFLDQGHLFALVRFLVVERLAPFSADFRSLALFGRRPSTSGPLS